MRSLSVKTFKEIPIYLVVAIIVAILLFSVLVIPAYRSVVEAQKTLKKEQSATSSIKQKINMLKTLPEFNIHLDTKEDMLLALKSVIEKSGYQITDVGDNKDKVGDTISFFINIGGYKSMFKVINDLETFRVLFPLYYSEYIIENRNIKVGAKCYIKTTQ